MKDRGVFMFPDGPKRINELSREELLVVVDFFINEQTRAVENMTHNLDRMLAGIQRDSKQLDKLARDSAILVAIAFFTGSMFGYFLFMWLQP